MKRYFPLLAIRIRVNLGTSSDINMSYKMPYTVDRADDYNSQYEITKMQQLAGIYFGQCTFCFQYSPYVMYLFSGPSHVGYYMKQKCISS